MLLSFETIWYSPFCQRWHVISCLHFGRNKLTEIAQPVKNNSTEVRRPRTSVRLGVKKGWKYKIQCLSRIHPIYENKIRYFLRFQVEICNLHLSACSKVRELVCNPNAMCIAIPFHSTSSTTWTPSHYISTFDHVKFHGWPNRRVARSVNHWPIMAAVYKG